MATRQRRHPLFRSSRPSSPPWSRRRWHCPVIPYQRKFEPYEVVSLPALPLSTPAKSTLLVTMPPPVLRQGVAVVRTDAEHLA